MFYFLQYFLSIDSSIFLTEKFYEYFSFGWLVIVILTAVITFILYKYFNFNFLIALVAAGIIVLIIKSALWFTGVGSATKTCSTIDDLDQNPKHIVLLDQTTRFTDRQKEKIQKILDKLLQSTPDCSALLLYSLKNNGQNFKPEFPPIVRPASKNEDNASQKELAKSLKIFQEKQQEWKARIPALLSSPESPNSFILETIDYIANQEFDSSPIKQQFTVFTDGIQFSPVLDFYHKKDSIPSFEEFLESSAGEKFQAKEGKPLKNTHIVIYFIKQENINNEEFAMLKKFWQHYFYILGADWVEIKAKI